MKAQKGWNANDVWVSQGKPKQQRRESSQYACAEPEYATAEESSLLRQSKKQEARSEVFLKGNGDSNSTSSRGERGAGRFQVVQGREREEKVWRRRRSNEETGCFVKG